MKEGILDDVKHLILSSAIAVAVSPRECADGDTAQRMPRGNTTHGTTGERQLHLRECDGNGGESADDGFASHLLPPSR